MQPCLMKRKLLLRLEPIKKLQLMLMLVISTIQRVKSMSCQPNRKSSIKHYQRMLARKREINGKLAIKSNNYLAVRIKLQRDYRKIANIQNDLLQKFTTKLVNNYDQIVIEDLAIQKMMMTHVASKDMQRSLFSRFRQILTYKCEWYSKKINLS